MPERRRRFVVLASLSLLAACGDGDPARRERHVAAPEGRPFEPPAPAPTSPEPTPFPTPVTFPKACSDLHDPALLPTFEIDVDPAIWERMKEEYFEEIENWYGPVTFRHGEEVRSDVMIRTRGNNSRCGEKIQITIGFNRIDRDHRFHGLRRLDLDHGGWGCRSLEERVALAWMREDLGLHAQCSNHARLVVNGEYYGLFGNLEHQDREFLERNFADPDGNLYKNGDEKTTNESDPDRSDIDAFWDAATVAELDAVADLDEMLLEWAAEAAIPARDNYWIHGWNYYLYNDSERGFLFIPNDMDQAHPAPDSLDFEPLPPRVAPATWLLEDPVWESHFLDVLEDVHEAFDVEKFEERIDTAWAQIRTAAHEDPFLHWNPDTDRYAGLKSRFRQRRDFLGRWMTCTRTPESAPDDDGDGWVWCEECRDSDPFVYPGAPERCGDGIDDDCDGTPDDGCAPPPPPLFP